MKNDAMMTLHTDVEKVCEYLVRKDMTLWKSPIDGGESPVASRADDVRNFSRESDLLWGAAHAFYLVSDKGLAKLSLRSAAAEIKSRNAPDEFLLAAYQDGGLICISGQPVSFQRGEPEAEWWEPY